MSEELYSVEQVADRLGLHVKTVRSYVREGRLKAVRIGKQYRIGRHDLEAFTGRPAPLPEPIVRERNVEVSSIVEIDAISREAANRVTMTLVSAASGIRIEGIYNEERARLKIILVGDLEKNAAFLKFIAAILESSK
jgi:excisionase family DNA binding protein